MATPPPLITVVIPTCNRLDSLTRCLEALASNRQEAASLVDACDQKRFNVTTVNRPQCSHSLQPDVTFYEVIVTDDGDGLASATMIAQHFPWVRWTQGPRRGPAANRNHGAQVGLGDWVAFIDDDCVATAGWLTALAQLAASSDVDVIEGKTVIPDKRDNPFLHGVENEHGGCYWSCNLAVRRKTFLDIGGFDEEFLQAGGEDMEFASRFQAHGLQAHFVPDALVLHPQRAYSVLGFLKRVKLLRWSLLYYQKVGMAPIYGSSVPKVASTVVRRHFTSLARETWRNLTGKNSGGWRTRLFYGLWGWIVVPYQLPHLLFWEFRFRSQRERAEKNRVA